jgi:hypothetical protein
MSSKSSSKHLDSDRKETKAPGEKKHNGGHLMDGIVGGLSRRVSPAIVDGIVRGISRDASPDLVGGQMSKVVAGATHMDRGTFGSGAFAQGK